MQHLKNLMALAVLASAAVAGAQSQAIVTAEPDEGLRILLSELLARNPEIAADTARSKALRLHAPQLKTLPEPQVGVTAFLLRPETRVGPQIASFSVAQRFPGFTKLDLREQTVLLEAEAADAFVEARRVKMLTRARTLYHEIAFVDAALDRVRSDRGTLAHFEELARARYASGKGLQQDVVKLQVEITRVEARLLELAAKRAALVASVNLLRDRPGMPVIALPTSGEQHRPDVLDWSSLRTRALATRPELRAARFRQARAETGVQLADRQSMPEFSVGLGYTIVGKRDDVPGLDDNGKDILGISGMVSVPVWRKRLHAAVDEAVQRKLAAEAELRAASSEIERELAELQGTIPEIQRRVRLFENTLLSQSEHSLATAEAAYAAGTVDSMALLDARRVLLDVHIAADRARADLRVSLARLEGVIAGPLNTGDRS